MALLVALERHASGAGISVLRLRAEPQPEALRFYVAAGFSPIAPFGRWIGDDTARCFEKTLEGGLSAGRHPARPGLALPPQA